MFDRYSAPTTKYPRRGRFIGTACSVGVALLVLSACSGLSTEPEIVATLPPSTPTAPSPTESAVSTVASDTAPSTAQASTQEASVLGTVSGNVTNGTAGASVPSSLAVTLHVMDQAGQETTFNAMTDSAGKYTFKDVPIRSDRAYAVTATYNNRPFRTEFIEGNVSSPTITLPLVLYELTDSADVISISGLTTRVNVSPDGLQIAQVTHFKNKSDRMYSTSKSDGKGGYASVSLSLPPGAKIMGFSDDESRYSISSDGTTVTDSAPVVPGEDHVLHVVYTLPYQDGMTIDQPVNYPLDGNVQLLVGPETVNASTQQLPSLGLQTQDDNSSIHSYGGPLTLAAGSQLTYQLNGTVANTANTASSTTGQPVLLSRETLVGLLMGLGLGIIIVGFLMLARDRFVGTRRATADERQHSIDRLVGQLARLDDEQSSGAISKTAYSKRRRRLKMQLAKLMKE